MSGEANKSLKNLICAGIVTLALAGYAKANLVDSNSVVQDSIEYYIQTNKSVYDLGEEVQMLYRVTNLRDVEVTVHFLDQVQYYFTVKDNGNLIWFTPKVGEPAGSSFVLPPSGYIEYTETWNMMNDNGTPFLTDDDFPAVPGNYEITGSLHPILLSQEDEDKYVPVSVSIEVIPEPAMIYYVDDDATGANDGSSWDNAFNYLQDALSVASSGDEIRVAQGIYKPDQGAGFTPGDRAATFQLINGVTIKGGYASFGEPDPDARNITAYKTILSGDLAGDDVEVGDPCALLTEPSRSENSGHILMVGHHGDDPPVLDGFTITGGHSDYSGGGLVMDEGDLMVVDCIFTYNSAGYCGGAMIGWNSQVIFERCSFIRNAAAKHGGATFMDTCTCRQGYMACIDCKFINNSAGQHGGAVHVSSMIETLTSLINCLMVGNRAGGCGGAFYDCSEDGSSWLVNCTLSGNLAEGQGDCGGWEDPSARLTNCILWYNEGEAVRSGDVSFRYSNVEDGPTGNGNIDADPCFVSPGYWDADGVWVDGDYHLQPDSPCINAGDPDFVAEPPGVEIPGGNYFYDWDDGNSQYIAQSSEKDLDGRPRLIGGRVDMGAYEYSPPIPAEVRIVPRTINLASKGKSITCHISLPEDYNVADIDPNSVFLEDEIQAESLKVDEQQQVAVAKFSRSEVQAILNSGEVELTITGQLTDGTIFEATDVIRVINKASKK